MRLRRLAVFCQQPAALVRSRGARCRQNRWPVTRHRRREVIRRSRQAGMAANCRRSAESRRPGPVLHPASPSYCGVLRGRRLDDLRDLPAPPSCLGVKRCRRLHDWLSHPAATNPREVAQSRRADWEAARPAPPSSASVKAGDREGSHRRRSRRALEHLDLDSLAAPTRCGAEIRPCPTSPVPGRRTRGHVGTAGLSGRRLGTTDQPATPSHSGKEKLDGRPYPTPDRRIRRCHRAVAPDGCRLGCPARELAATTRHAAADTDVPLPRQIIRHLGWDRCLVAAPSCRASAVTTVPPARHNCRRPGSVQGWAAAPRRCRLQAVLGQPAAHSHWTQEARAPRVVRPTLRTVGSPRDGTSTCTARAPRAALDDDDAGRGDAPCRAPGPACGS